MCINKNILKIVTFLYDNACIFKNTIWYNAVLLIKYHPFTFKLLVARLRSVTRPLFVYNSTTFRVNKNESLFIKRHRQDLNLSLIDKHKS